MKRSLLVAAIETAVLLSACGASDQDSPEQVQVEQSSHALGACTISSISSGTKYDQHTSPWGPKLLGNHATDTIGGYGCVISSLSMAYHNVWGVSTNPDQLNTSAKAAGCFQPGSSLVDVACAINSRGGPHIATSINMTDVAAAICAGTPVMVTVTWGDSHKMLVYS